MEETSRNTLFSAPHVPGIGLGGDHRDDGF